MMFDKLDFENELVTIKKIKIMKKIIITLVVLIFVTNVFAQNNRVCLKTKLIEFKEATIEQRQKYMDSLETVYPSAENEVFQKTCVCVDSVEIRYYFKNNRSFIGDAKSLSDAIRVFDKTAIKEDKEIITSMNEYYFLSFVSGKNGQLIIKYAYQEKPGRISLVQQDYANTDNFVMQFEAFEIGRGIKTIQKYFSIKILPWCQDFAVEKNGKIILRAKYENGTFIFCEGTKVSEWLMPTEL